MDIRNVGHSGNVDRTGDRGKRTEPKRADAQTGVVRDGAEISAAGRETAAAIEDLAERARRDDDRDEIVAAAMKRLSSGELDDAAVFAETARRLADGGFLSV